MIGLSISKDAQNAHRHLRLGSLLGRSWQQSRLITQVGSNTYQRLVRSAHVCHRSRWVLFCKNRLALSKSALVDCRMVVLTFSIRFEEIYQVIISAISMLTVRRLRAPWNRMRRIWIHDLMCRSIDHIAQVYEWDSCYQNSHPRAQGQQIENMNSECRHWENLSIWQIQGQPCVISHSAASLQLVLIVCEVIWVAGIYCSWSETVGETVKRRNSFQNLLTF